MSQTRSVFAGNSSPPPRRLQLVFEDSATAMVLGHSFIMSLLSMSSHNQSPTEEEAWLFNDERALGRPVVELAAEMTEDEFGRFRFTFY